MRNEYWGFQKEELIIVVNYSLQLFLFKNLNFVIKILFFMKYLVIDYFIDFRIYFLENRLGKCLDVYQRYLNNENFLQLIEVFKSFIRNGVVLEVVM